MFCDRMARAVLIVLACVSGASADEPMPVVRHTYVSTDGVGEIFFDAVSLADMGLSLSAEPGSRPGRGGLRGPAGGSSVLRFDLESTEFPLRVVITNGDLDGVRPGAMSSFNAPLRLTGSSGETVAMKGLSLIREAPEESEFDFGVYAEGPSRWRLFDLAGATLDVQSDSDTALLYADVRLSGVLAASLGIEGASGAGVGRLEASIHLELIEAVVVQMPDPAAGSHPWSAGGGGSEGPDVIVGSLASCQQFGRAGTTGSGVVGLAIGTDSCNKGDEPFHWFSLPNGDHPMIPMQLYRLRTVEGSERFEQLGYSWMKHGFSALQHNICGFGCTPSGTVTLLGVGCSDPYSTGLNAQQCGLGPRSAINPFTGTIPLGSNLGSGGGCTSNYPSKDHRDHDHSLIAHRIQVWDTDLLPELNEGARYFGEAQYLNPHEYAVANGNQNNNVSRRELAVTGPSASGVFTFTNVGITVRESPAISAWEGAEMDLIEPEPLVDGRSFLASKVTDLGGGQWHYEYALYNMNMDRAIRWFSVPLPPGVTVSNIGFHQPLHHDPEPHTENYSTVDWEVSVSDDAIIWSTDSYIVDPMANAIRFGTLYNFRFDADAPSQGGLATVGLFKTLDSTTVRVPIPMEAAPIVVHGSAVESFSAVGFGGYVDSRAESADGLNVDLGLTEVTFRFSAPVEDANGGELTPASFEVRQTGGGTPPSVVEAAAWDDRTVTVTLDRIITLKEWTTIQAHVRSIAAGVPITNHGDQGSGVNEPDRIDIAYLPLDVDQNGAVQPIDLLRFRQIMGQVYQNPRGTNEDYVDTDRNGSIAPIDLLKFRQLWSGTGTATQPWAGETLNHERP